jgi:hypothetical protein
MSSIYSGAAVQSAEVTGPSQEHVSFCTFVAFLAREDARGTNNAALFPSDTVYLE